MLKKSFYQPFKLFFLFTIFINFFCNYVAVANELKEASRDYCQRYGKKFIMYKKPSLWLSKVRVVIQSLETDSAYDELVDLFRRRNMVAPPKSGLADVFRCRFDILAGDLVISNIFIFKTKKEAQYYVDDWNSERYNSRYTMSMQRFYSSKDKKKYYMIGYIFKLKSN